MLRPETVTLTVEDRLRTSMSHQPLCASPVGGRALITSAAVGEFSVSFIYIDRFRMLSS